MKYKIVALCLLSLGMLGGCSKEQAIQATEVKEQVVDTLNLDHKDVFTLKVGSCFNEESDSVEGEQISSIPMRECSEPHQNEVFFIHNLPDAEKVPSDAEVEQQLNDFCIPAFEQFTGVAYDDSELEIGYFSPSAQSWGTGDRELVCYVAEPDSKMVSQSLKDAKR